MKTRNLLILVVTILTTFTFSSNFLQAEFIWKEVYKMKLNEDPINIQCIDSTNCIMLVGNNKTQCRLYESNNKGISWTQFYDFDFAVNSSRFVWVLNMAWPSENYLYLTYSTGAMLKSSDRGRSFHDTVFFPYSTDFARTDFLYHIYMKDSVNGIIGAMTRDIYTTNDGWNTYIKHENAPGVSIYDVWMQSPSTFMALVHIVQQGNAFIKTTDAGENWSIYFWEEKVQMITSFWFINEDLGFAVGSGHRIQGDSRHDVIMRTQDGGNTWENVYYEYIPPYALGLGSHLQYKGVSFLDEKNGIAVGAASKILRTTDGGDTWFQEYLEGHEETPSLRQNNRGLSAYYIGTQAVIAGDQSESIYHLTNSTNISELLTNNNIQVNTYPNPFSESVSFEFPAELTGKQISLSIYDMLGNLQAEENFIYSPSMGILQYTPKHSPATGVYFYRLRIGDKEHTGTLIKQ